MEAVLKRAEQKLAARLAFELAAIEDELDDSTMEERAKLINAIARTLKLAKELTMQRQAGTQTAEEENQSAVEYRAELSRRIEKLGQEQPGTGADQKPA